MGIRTTAGLGFRRQSLKFCTQTPVAESISKGCSHVQYVVTALNRLLTLYTKEGGSRYAFFHILVSQGKNVRVVKWLINEVQQTVKSPFATQSSSNSDSQKF